MKILRQHFLPSIFLPIFLWYLGHCALAQQAPAATASASAVTDSLRPALSQVGPTLHQVQISHWKVSRAWKSQLLSDADSIQQDLNTTLPMLLQTAQQTPAALEPQLAVMQNVNALYDVLVRITAVGDVAGGAEDATALDSTVQHLEQACKSASTQLLQAATRRDHDLAKLQAVAKPPVPSGTPSKVIVVNNEVRHHAKHPAHRKSAPAANNPAPSKASGSPPSAP